MKPEDPVFSELHKAKILVVGDVMLDRYWFGEPTKISDEAPVLVVKIEPNQTDERPGGAGNVALNAAALGADVVLLSVIGEDEPGYALERLLEKDRVKTSFHRDPKIATTVKLRIVARRRHQLLRVDFETPPTHEILLAKLADYERMIADRNVIILSDYAKGGLTHIARMIELARAQNKTVLVDPKGDDYSRYVGATVITPNRAEFGEVVGKWKTDKEFEEKAQVLRAQLKLKALLVTLGEDGMKLCEADGVRSYKARAREVFDVSGAGDTVIGTLGVMMGAGLSLRDAVPIANQAAGIVVGKFGAVAVTKDELLAARARD